MKKVLILGAGLVAKPIVTFLLENNYRVTVASRTKSKADAMIKNHPNGVAVGWTTDDANTMEKLIKEHDLSVSLLPYAYHVEVAKLCIKYGKDMVTTSYVKPEMQDLDEDAKKAGVIILNEIGLDPGIDHMSAMRIIDHVHGKNGKIEEFYSLCGALPAPQNSDNPFKYKFSWSPKGVVMAGNNDGKYLKHGKEFYVPTEKLFSKPFSVDFPEIGKLDVYPNRDSIQYIDIYDIPEAKTMFRGTFRFPGWCETLDAIKKLHLISYDKINMEGLTYADMVARLIGTNSSEGIKQKVADFLHLEVDSHPLKAIEWLGIFENTPMERKEDSPFEVTSDLMIGKMQLGVHEKDMVALQHVFLASYPDGSSEVIKSRMLDFGTPATDTSIARTVALPAAIAVKMIMEGKITIKGVYRPVVPGIYNPVLDELETIGIKMVEEYGLPLDQAIQ